MREDQTESRLQGLGDASPAVGSNEKAPTRYEKFKKSLPRLLVYARYLLPALCNILLLALSFFDLVYFYMLGQRWKMPLFDFYKNVLTEARNYLGTATTAAKDGFYGLLAAGALVGILVFLISAFLSGFTAFTAWRAFRAGERSAESNRMKTLFRVVFPGRRSLFLANCLVLIPAAYPHYYAVITRRFLEVSGGGSLHSVVTVPLIVMAALVLCQLVLAVLTPAWERRCHLNMFALWHPDEEKRDSE